jgi:FAD:protein FMN transferase
MGNAVDSVRVRHAEHVMGTVVSFNVPAAFAGEPLAEAVRWLHWVDARFSPFRPDSDVSRLGRGDVSLDGCAPEVGSVLAACESMSAASGGYFSATYAGRLDPSGYVKGWAVERAAALLTEAGSASHCVNGGGDVQCVGGRGAGLTEQWRVGIADPLRPGSLCRVIAGGGAAGTGFAVATSSVAERGAHIIDPHTGLPATGLVSVTVIGPHLTLADAYATAAVAMGGAAAREWIEALDGYCGFAVEADGTTWETTGFDACRVTDQAHQVTDQQAVAQRESPRLPA